MIEPILEIKNLRKAFGPVEVLRDIQFSVKKGEATCIIGSSGSGKSTLLRCINLLETPTSGSILFKGQDILESPVPMSKYHAKVGMVFQQFNLFQNMTVLANCTVGQTKVLGRGKKDSESRAMYYLEKVGMHRYIHAKPAQISGGQKQRVAIARALSMEPEILLFDEPTSALDPESVGEVLEVLSKLIKSDLTVLIVTHEMAFARDVASRVVFMDEGVIVEDSDAEALFTNPKFPRTREFLSRVLKATTA